MLFVMDEEKHIRIVTSNYFCFDQQSKYLNIENDSSIYNI